MKTQARIIKDEIISLQWWLSPQDICKKREKCARYTQSLVNNIRKKDTKTSGIRDENAKHQGGKITTFGWHKGLEQLPKPSVRKRKTILYWRMLIREERVDLVEIEEHTAEREELKNIMTAKTEHLKAIKNKLEIITKYHSRKEKKSKSGREQHFDTHRDGVWRALQAESWGCINARLPPSNLQIVKLNLKLRIFYRTTIEDVKA